MSMFAKSSTYYKNITGCILQHSNVTNLRKKIFFIILYLITQILYFELLGDKIFIRLFVYAIFFCVQTPKHKTGN
jgi:hypothetical protein